jgi:hypothetical protein
MLLMAVTPFFAWRRQNITKLAENLLWPFVGSLAFAIIWAFSHSKEHPASVLSLWLIS